jgi:hypothetical protein
MSSPPITDPQTLRELLPGRSLAERLIRPVKRLAFWTAVVLPFFQLPLLATGLDSRSLMLAFVGLVVLNVSALWIGHAHGTGE